ncbi:MAG: DUF3990 domain-containing protein [Prevotella sp.]|nr:DUF3990 domain-containing protein [Prevotella sp.]
MRLYHGTNIDFDTIDLSKSFPFKDFGQGFYLSEIRSQAERMAKRKCNTLGGKPIVQEYEFDESWLHNKDIKTLIFENTTPEWAKFIFNNRSRDRNFHHDYDIVVGPIADDGVAFLISQYQAGAITLPQFTRMLKFRKLNSQYFFGTAEALRLLKRIR